MSQCDKANNKPSPKSPQMGCHNHQNASCLWHGVNPTSLIQNIQTRFDLVTFHRRQCFSFCWIDGIMTAFETAGMRFLQLTSRELSWSLWIFSTVHGCQKTSYSTRKNPQLYCWLKPGKNSQKPNSLRPHLVWSTPSLDPCRFICKKSCMKSDQKMSMKYGKHGVIQY